MYEPYKDGSVNLQISITWDKNTARGFVVSIFIMIFILLFLAAITPPYYQEETTKYEISKIPFEILEWNPGEGDGTGKSKGNLTKEGAMAKGKLPQSALDDASKAAKADKNLSIADESDLVSSNITPKSELGSGNKNEGSTGTGKSNVGSTNGTENGTGLGDKGTGKGAGFGLGDIEWGGGGNRITTYKPPTPKYPENVNIRDAEIRIKFWVDPNGTVIRAVPLNKVDPRLEQVAINYVKRYKFNALETDSRVMEGILKVIFRKR